MRGALRAATIGLSAVVAIAVTPPGAHAQDLSCAPGDQEVEELDFRGNRTISDKDLALRVTTTPSSQWRVLGFGTRRCLNHDELPRDVLRVKAYYRERGFYSTQVDTLVQPLPKGKVRVVFNIAEGRPTRLASYVITGLEGLPDSADIMHHLQLHVGDPFDFGRFKTDIDTVVHRLRDEGYYRADALSGYDRDTSYTAHATITAVRGKRARFGEPQFNIDTIPGRGQQISTAVIRRIMGFRPGDWYSDRAIVDAQRNLFQLGTYRHLEVAPLADSLQPPGDSIVILEVRLSEDYMRQLDSEVGWATLDCGRVRLQYTDKNLFGTARRLELNGQASKIGYGDPLETQATRDFCTLRWLGGSRNQTALAEDRFSLKMHYFLGATVRQPRLLGTRWVPALSVYSERRGEFKAYLRSTQVGADLSATRDLTDRMPLRLAYTVEYGQTTADPPALCALFNRCDPESRRIIGQRATLGVASAALARLRTDNLISPTRGYVMRGEARSSASRLLGTSDSLFFNKATGDAAWYRQLGWGNVLALRVRGGAVFGRRISLSEEAGTIPPQERLYAGGPTSVRGFQQNELGSLVYIARSAIDTTITMTASGPVYQFQVQPGSTPSLERAVPLGGNSLVVTNIEYRIRDRLFFPNLVQYTLFLDGGDVWSRGRDTLSMRWTPGVGLRAFTAVGPVTVNVGYNGYQRDQGPLYYNPDVTTLLCVAPGNTIQYRLDTNTNILEQVDKNATCPSTFSPPRRTRLLQKLTFTFSIGSDF